MENTIKKRVRSANWDEQEKRLLTQLIMERLHIIENKDTSTNTNNLKKEAWQEVLPCFNSLNKNKRDITQLMTQWRNTKGKVKSRESEYRRARLLTGGGPPPPSPSAEDLAIIQALPNEFTVDSNNFDSDSVYLKTIKQSQPESPNIVMDSIEPIAPTLPTSEKPSCSQDVVELQEDQTNVLLATTPKALGEMPTSRKRCRPIKKRKDDDYEHELFLLAKKSKERENERAEEIHQQKMIILNLEAEYWRKKLKE